MKLNLLINLSESKSKGPGKRASNLLLGLGRLNIDYDICSDDLEFAVGIQAAQVFNRWERMPSYAYIGPNVIHESSAHMGIANKFHNYIVQSNWVADYWKWENERAKNYNFLIYPASVDIGQFEHIIETRKPERNCLFYTKYQSKENHDRAAHIYLAKGHTSIEIEYGKYDAEQLKDACAKTEYCIFNSCCEKSSNALLEIMATGLPVYVVDNKRWIGDDKFEKCSSAPDFDRTCGIIGDYIGSRFEEFYDKVRQKNYDTHAFIKSKYTVETVAQNLVNEITKTYVNERS